MTKSEDTYALGETIYRNSDGCLDFSSRAQDYAADYLLAGKKASTTYRWSATPPAAFRHSGDSIFISH
jgi:hypothetical protein